MDDRQALIDEENEERLETGAPPIPGGSAEARSHGGAVAAAVKVAASLEKGVLVCIVCDRGDRYLSSDLFTRES